MPDSDEQKVRWTVTNPFDHEVILKEDTLNYHIAGDHSESDAAKRKEAENQVKDVVRQPHFIVKDSSRDNRYKYMDLIPVPFNDEIKIRYVTVIIDTEKSPHEVVTWIPQSKLKDTAKNEEVVYDVHKGIITKK